MENTINRLEGSLRDMSQRLIDPRKQIQDYRLQMDDYTSRLIRHAQILVDRRKERFQWWKDRMLNNSPAHQSRNMNVIIEQNRYKLIKSFEKIIEKKLARLRELRGQLETLSPIGILKRGYSITRTIPDLKVVIDPKIVSLEQDLEVMVAKGTLTCRVKGKSENGPENI
jgi:exodeoxyribonuclease VII large subunit